ncbi:GNAT family N-acetyltransferase [Bacillus infantis]|uniref:GNAT family N-acetyltransferase n=1 Tax=Bacillus infantis TaxID=324767 RepID=UPI00209C7644|nr:GNAT family N-acetyltransferase [Bacillus infantis]MCP1157277.1 GNAT family N-acetyltransferase [Bacillus infantis]
MAVLEKLTFVSGYEKNRILRRSFNELAKETFGIQFENWFDLGYWSDKYIPYSFADGEKVVANASANLIGFSGEGKDWKAVQVGTVMTHKDYRNLGLARQLMERILEDYQEADFIYLFANSTVLDFYPKFGFSPVEEMQYFIEANADSNQSEIRKLDGRNPEDLSFIYEMAGRRTFPGGFDAVNTRELLMFYCLNVFHDDIYHLPEDRAIVLARQEKDVLHVYDIISSEPDWDPAGLAGRLAEKETNRAVLYFTPSPKTDVLEKVKYQDSHVLFVKYNGEHSRLPAEFKHPLTVQA